MGRAAERTCRLRIGGVAIDLVWPTRALGRAFTRYFRADAGEGEPTIRLSLELIPHNGMRDPPSSLFTTKEIGQGGFSVAQGLVTGTYCAEAREGVLRVSELLVRGRARRVFEQLLYQAFYTARNAAGYDAFLIHSSSVLRDGAGFLFTGRSGSGKSTVAKLSKAYRVLNDEISLISFERGGVFLSGTPFNGYYRGKSPGTAPLAAILFLTHAPEHALLPATSREAVETVLREIVPPLGVEELMTHETRGAMLRAADRLTGLVPVRRMAFLPDGGFWKVLEAAFLSPAEVAHANA